MKSNPLFLVAASGMRAKAAELVPPTREQLQATYKALIALMCHKQSLVTIMTDEINDCVRQAAEIERELRKI